MSAVDPKPTYTRTVEGAIVAIATTCAKKRLHDELLKVTGIQTSTLERLDLAALRDGGKLIDWADNEHDHDGESDLSMYAELFALGETRRHYRSNPDTSCVIGETLLRFIKGCSSVLIGSAAAYALMDDVVIKEVNSALMIPEDFACGLRIAEEYTAAASAICKTNYQLLSSHSRNMHSRAVRQCAGEITQRKVAEDISYHTISRRVRLMYNLLLGRHNSKLFRSFYPDGLKLDDVYVRLTGRIRRNEDQVPDIEYCYLGPIRIIKRNGVAYIMDTDNIRKVYYVIHRRTIAVLNSVLSTVNQPTNSFTPPAVVRTLTSLLITAASNLGKECKPISFAARAMHQLWCANFARAYESMQGDGEMANWEDRYMEIFKSACVMSPIAHRMSEIVDKLPQNVALDALRLHHIMSSPDTPPELLAGITNKIPEGARKPNAARFDEFMRFAKTYELCMYLYRKRDWPNTAGEDAQREHKSYNMCLRGKFSMPDARDHGKIWIESHFPYIRYADQLAIRAKDATRVPDDAFAAKSIQPQYNSWEHNELLHAIKKGNNLGTPHMLSVDDARSIFWDATDDRHVLIQTAAKAEATKSDCKPRGTFSATGEFRHFQGEFDRNCQVMNDILGCGSLRADPVNHAKGMARVAHGTRMNHISTSHDIEGWSPSQDRKAFCTFGKYRAAMFKGVDPEGWASSWTCFDSVVNKNGYVSHAHIDNGGFQGFPGTLDTSLHVLILVHFLYRMRAAGKIPRDTPTLAKATIDDCLAQIAVWDGKIEDLERELTNHYKLMGYVIDSVKSVISKCKAIYLNQAMIRGAFVHQGSKVICKMDRPLEVVLKTPLDDAAGCYSGAKAAMQAGNDPLVSFFLATTLAASYICRASPRFGMMNAQAASMAMLLPRGDGGLGFPTMADLICKEHPDPRAQANHAVYMWARSAADTSVRIHDTALAVWAHCKHTPMAVASKMRIFFNPRSIVRSNVPQLESIKRQAVIQAAKLWADADPYRGVLKMADSESLAAVYSHLLAGAKYGVDCAFLEAYASHLPEKMLDSIVGKVTSYRVAKELLGDYDVRVTQGRIDAKFRMLIDNFASAVYPADFNREIVMDTLTSVSGYSRSKDEREEFYALNQVILINHTIASPFEVLTMSGLLQPEQNTPHIGSEVGSLIHYAPDSPLSSHSVVSRHGIAYPFKAQNWVVDSLDEHRNLDQVTHTFVEGCAVVEWAKAHGANAAPWEFVYLHRWLGHSEVSTSDFLSHAMQGSIKRSAAAAGDRCHPIFIGQNIQRSVKVNVAVLQTIVSDGSYDIDPLSVVAASYAIGVFNLIIMIDSFSTQGIPLKDFHWSFGIHTECLEERHELMIDVAADMGFIEGVFELELDEMSYSNVGGGTERMLVAIAKPGALRAFLAGVVSLHDAAGMDMDGLFDDQTMLAPMFTAPTEAPPGALFIMDNAPKRAVGLIVSDHFTSATRVRVINVSSASTKSCVQASLQSAAVNLGYDRIARYSVGDTDAVDAQSLKAIGVGVARDAAQIIRDNLAMSAPALETARGLRACGMTKFDWFNPNKLNVNEMADAFGKYVDTNRVEFMHTLRKVCPEYASLSKGEYSATTKSVRIAKDPEHANALERVVQIKRKFKARAAQYGSRVKMLKAEESIVQQDVRGGTGRDAVASRVAYLAGAKCVMGALEFVDGPSVDNQKTAEHMLSSINAKLEKHNALPSIYDSALLLEGNLLSPSGVMMANQGIHEWWWKPEEFTRGAVRAMEWAHTDCETEKKEVYFVPRTVTVVTKMRRNIMTSTPLELQKQDIMMETLSTVGVVRGVDDEADVGDEAGPDEGEGYDDDDDDFSDLFQQTKAAPSVPKTMGDYRVFTATLAAWQLSIMSEQYNVSPPKCADRKQKVDWACKRFKLTEEDLSEEVMTEGRENLAEQMFDLRAPMVAIEWYEEETGEDLVV